jgi:hypothetical protein
MDRTITGVAERAEAGRTPPKNVDIPEILATGLDPLPAHRYTVLVRSYSREVDANDHTGPELGG